MYVAEYLLLFAPKSITTTFSDDFMPKLERLRQSAMTLDLASSLISASPPLTMLQARQSSGARRFFDPRRCAFCNPKKMKPGANAPRRDSQSTTCAKDVGSFGSRSTPTAGDKQTTT